GSRRADDGLHLDFRPGVLAVAEVLALEAVDAAVAVRVGLVVDRHLLLGDARGQDVVVTQTSVGRATVADHVDLALLADDTVAQRARQARVPLPADLDGVVVPLGHGVMDHHPVYGPP